MLLAEGYDMRMIIEEAKARSEKPFYHWFDVGLLRISYERLKQIGAIAKTGALTELGYMLLSYPLDVYYGRMLHESIERGCVDEMMIITAILEKKWFLSKEDTWKELWLVKSGTSDLTGYATLFRFFTATEITPKQAERLKELWVNPDEIDDFMSRKHSKNNPKLFEIVDLAPIGVKKARIKAIYDKYLELQKRFDTLWIAISNGKDKNAIAISIATGSIFHHYVFQEQEGWFVSQKQRGKDGDIFRVGDISIIEPEDGRHYVWQPFIIGPKDETGSWMRLLSFVTQVDDAILKEASVTNARYAKAVHVHELKDARHAITSVVWGASGHDIESGDTTATWVRIGKWKLLIWTDATLWVRKLAHYPDIAQGEETYANSLDQLSDAPFTSDEAARDYYLRYCLPLFLIEHNQAIKKYVRGKSWEWVSIFRELLTRFVLDEAHRIRLQNLEVTERSFRYDSWILQRFEESDDFHIRYFRIHGVLPEIRWPKVNDETSDDFDMPENPDQNDMEALRKEYAKRLGWANAFYLALDPDQIEERYFVSRVSQIGEGQGSEQELLAYSVIQSVYDSFGRKNQSEREPISRALKKINARKKDIEKLSKKVRSLEEVYEALYFVSDQRYSVPSIAMHQKTLQDAKKIFEWFGIQGPHYELSLERAFSQDKRKRKRGAASLKWYRAIIEKALVSYEGQIREWEAQITFTEFPELRMLWDMLDALAREMYQEDYMKLRIQPKILDTMRHIVRDHGGEHLWLDAILVKFLYQKWAWKFLHAHGKYFAEMHAYCNTWEVIENHQVNIAEEIKQSEDIVYIGYMLEWLMSYIALLQWAHQTLKENPLYKNFHGS